MTTVQEKWVFETGEVVYDIKDTYIVLDVEVEGHLWKDDDRIIACKSLSTGEIVGRHEYELRGMSQYFKYRSANIVMYSDNGADEGKLATLTTEHMGRYTVRVAETGQYTEPKLIEGNENLYSTIMPVWLTSQILEKLGFTTSDNAKTWSNGYVKLYSEYPAYDSKTIFRYQDVQLDRYFSVELLHDRMHLLLGGENDHNQIRTVHELQNLYRDHIKFPLQTIGLFM